VSKDMTANKQDAVREFLTLVARKVRKKQVELPGGRNAECQAFAAGKSRCWPTSASRLLQGRAGQPCWRFETILDAIAQALLLDDCGARHLFDLGTSGESVRRSSSTSLESSTSIPSVPQFVLDSSRAGRPSCGMVDSTLSARKQIGRALYSTSTRRSRHR